MQVPDTTGISRVGALVARGAAVGGGLGAALGGVAGTVDWPVVGTFFGGIAGAVEGGFAGAVTGAVLWLLVRQARSPWAARAVTGVVLVLLAVMGAWTGAGVVGMSRPVEVVLIAVGVLAGAAAGPPIVHGFPVGVGRLAGRFLLGGLVAGAALGGLAGLVIGVVDVVHGLADTPVVALAAVVEGAVFGTVSGEVLACLSLGAVLLVRARPAG